MNHELTGILASGLGEGAYFMSIPQYQQKFKLHLGYNPFKGTLNLKINIKEAESFINKLKSIDIPGFTVKDKSFGPVILYKIKINNIDAAIIKPIKTRHSDEIIEVIAEHNLRQKLNIKDKDMVTLTI